MAIVYPVSRLLENPKTFNAISRALGWPNMEILRDTFYDLLEFEFGEMDVEECEFEAEEVCFEVEGEKPLVCLVTLDTGLAAKLEAVEEEAPTQIASEMDLNEAMKVHRKILSALERNNPHLKDDISLEHPPTPSNGYLFTRDGEHLAGEFHLRSNPETKFSFKLPIEELRFDLP